MNKSLLDILTYRSQYQSDKKTYIFLKDGETESASLTYGELNKKACSIASHLQSFKGERALLLYPSGLEFITAFFGCLYAGVIAVPVYPPRRNQKLSRLLSIVNDAQATVALTTTSILADIEQRWTEEPELAQLKLVATDTLESNGKDFVPEEVTPDSLAFLQYTSGSTGIPKGVMVTHGNIIHNQQMIQTAFGHSEKTIFAGWLPLFHDMGLIGNVLQPMYMGISCILMPPVAFLQKPIRWLKAISKYRVTTSGGPNFAYDLCVSKVCQEDLASLDLSSWDLAFNGAEPLRAETLEQFAKKFTACGFNEDAFYPCYGMAETTLFTAGGHKNQSLVIQGVKASDLEQNLALEAEIFSPESRVFVGCGHPYMDTTVIIVNPKSFIRCSPEQVGEIWVSSPSVTAGYWNRPDATKETFQAYVKDTGSGPFLRTGDLGFLKNGELFVTGRLKDVIIIRGRNYYPQDIELTLEKSHPSLRSNCSAAFSVEIEGEERLVVVCEVERTYIRKLNTSEVIKEIQIAVSTEHELEVYGVVLLRTGSIPKTSSGKIQRRVCKQKFLENSLNLVGKWQKSIENNQSITNPYLELNHQDNFQNQQSKTVAEIEIWLINKIAQVLQIAAVDIDLKQPFAVYGLDSIKAVSIAGDLEQWLGISVAPTIVYDYPTPRLLANYLGQKTSQQAEGASQRTTESEAVAIIGKGCRFPGSNNPQAFWSKLRSGDDAITRVPVSRWQSDNDWGGFLELVDQFDAQFFNLSPRETINIDPQQRLLLEVSWEALENAGLAAEQLAGSRGGVFIGISSGDYVKLSGHFANTQAYYATGNALSIAANRLSYFLDWHGPSWSVDTACSSSLVAVHQACQSLLEGECEIALAGGVNLILTPQLTLTFSTAGMMSADGRCKTFDAEADGYVRGEGCGVVVLKRLNDAIRDRDNIQAIIRGSAVNQDGLTNGLTAPNGNSQQEVVRLALAKAGIKPSQISYVETHGTGTSLGDPIEVNSLKEVLSRERESNQTCWIGSVKTNIGHLEAAAGIAGLIKVILSFEHQEIPPHLHLKQLNPYIKIENTNIQISTSLQPWVTLQDKRLAGVSSFGFGGTNAHVILEEAALEVKRPPANKSDEERERPLQLLTLSAKSENALLELVSDYQNYLETHQSLALTDICFTANTGRTHFGHRLAIIASDKQELADKLALISTQEEINGVFKAELCANNKSPKIAFLFTGQGSQYINMGKQLYETQPVFRQALEQCNEILQTYLEKSILDVIYPENNQELDNSIIDQTAYTQPALFAIEYALYKLWESWGIKPDVVMGHSVGEYVAATVAGVFSLEDGLKLIAHRGRLMQQLLPGGEMLAVMASYEQVNQLIAPYSEQVAIAAINGPQSVVISGEAEAVAKVKEILDSQEIKTKQLQVSHAFHSHLMEPMLAEFRLIASEITYNQPSIPLISNITEIRADNSISTVTYWVNHVRQPVKFAQSMETLHQEAYQVFLEIGPKPILLGMGRQCLPEDSGIWLSSLRQYQEDWQQMLQSLGELYVRGVKVDWLGFDQDYHRNKVILPTYPFQRQRYWIETSQGYSHQLHQQMYPLLGSKVELANTGQIIYQQHINLTNHPWIRDHRVYNTAVIPGVSYIAMTFAAVGTPAAVAEVNFVQPLILESSDVTRETQLLIHPADSGQNKQNLEVFSRDATSKNKWQQHCQIILLNTEPSLPALEVDIKALGQQLKLIDGDLLKDIYAKMSLVYGPMLEAITQAWIGEEISLLEIEVPQALESQLAGEPIHPVLLDACTRLTPEGLDNFLEQPGVFWAPWKVEGMTLIRPAPPHFYAYINQPTLVNEQLQTRTCDIHLLDEMGQIFGRIDGFTIRRAPREAFLKNLQVDIDGWLYKIHWEPQSTSPHNQWIDLTKPGSWLIFSPPTSIGEHLREFLEQKGHNCILVTPGENYQQLESQHYQINPINGSEFERLLQEGLEQQPPLQGIVHLWSLDETIAPLVSAQELQRSQELGCGSVLHLVQALVKNQGIESPPLWLVTQGSQSVGNESVNIQFQQTSLWGLGRVIAQEHGELQCRCLDLDPAVEDSQAVPALLQEVLSGGDENQIAYRQGVRHVARLERQQKNLTSRQVSIGAEGSYLITGGLGALGLNTARWMVEQGAKHLILTGRRQPDSKAQETINELEESGAQILVLRGDISQKEDVSQILEKIEASLPALKGVIHAAGVLDDALLLNMNWEQFKRVMVPKVEGAWHLHDLTQEKPLDFFVCFSSMASLLGSPGQGNYAAANAFMDGLVHHRRSIGLPGLSINWGPWSQGGMASRLDNQHLSRIQTQGITPITPEQGLQVLTKLLGQNATQVGVLPINWSQFLRQLSGEIKMPLVEVFSLAQTTVKAKDFRLLEQLQTASPKEREKLLITHLQSQVAQVLGMSASQIDVQQSLTTMGLDSLMAVELRNRLQTHLGIDIPIVKFIEDITTVDLATEVNFKLSQVAQNEGVESENNGQFYQTNGKENERIRGEL